MKIKMNLQTYAQKYPFRALLNKIKDPIRDYFWLNKLYFPFGFKEGHIWRIRHFGWITYYWDVGKYQNDSINPKNIGNWAPLIHREKREPLKKPPQRKATKWK